MGRVNLAGRDLLSVADLSPEEVQSLLQRARDLKGGGRGVPLEGKVLALLFEKPSLRTRVSFEVAMARLGGRSLYLGREEVGLGVREPIRDFGRVLSRYVDGIACRTFSQRNLEELAEASSVPVINALSDQEHPCQALADLLTIWEKKGGLQGVVVAFVGDGNNVAASLALACASVGAVFAIASPEGYELPETVFHRARERARQTGGEVLALHNAMGVVMDADVVYTDVWVSMGQEAEARHRRWVFRGYRVDEALLSHAKPDAIFMHPMPAHYGEEVPPGFLEHPQSVAYDQAENRLHLQTALLEALLAP